MCKSPYEREVLKNSPLEPVTRAQDRATAGPGLGREHLAIFHSHQAEIQALPSVESEFLTHPHRIPWCYSHWSLQILLRLENFKQAIVHHYCVSLVF